MNFDYLCKTAFIKLKSVYLKNKIKTEHKLCDSLILTELNCGDVVYGRKEFKMFAFDLQCKSTKEINANYKI